MKPRDAFVETFLKGLSEILPGHKMEKLYRSYFAGLSDKAFAVMVEQVEARELILPLVVPVLNKSKISTERNLALGKKWGLEFYQHLTLTDPTDPSVTLVTPEKYLVVDMFVRRQSQTLDAKRSIPKDASHIDDLTGQVTGESKGSALTKPELHVMDFHNLESCITEFIKARGGDNTAWEAMERSILETGSVNLDQVDDGHSRAKSTEMQENWLKAAHIGNNLTGR